MRKRVNSIVAAVLLVTALVLGGAVVAGLPATDAAAAACNVNNNPLRQGVNCAQPDDVPIQLFGGNGIFNTVANILIFIVGIIAVIMLIIGGIRYAVSGGDQAAVTSAKNTILYAIVGLIVAFLAFAIVNFVTTQLQENTAYIRALLGR